MTIKCNYAPWLTVVIVLVIGLPVVNYAATEWPIVKKLNKKYEFKDAKTASVNLTIYGEPDRPLYKLECHNKSYEDDPNFDYSGDFECKLVSIPASEGHRTLLTEYNDNPRDWESRGRFFADELKGKCATYPDYGRIRTFRLRGMQIVLEMSNVKTVKNALKREELGEFSFDVTVKPDTTANRSIAEPSQYLEPRQIGQGKEYKLDCGKKRRLRGQPLKMENKVIFYP